MATPETLFPLVVRLQQTLESCLNALGGTTRNGLLRNFQSYSAHHINRAALGFTTLKMAQQDYAARLLVRPAMEAMFRLLAVKAKPSALFGIALHEFNEDKKWFQAIAPGSNLVSEVDAARAEFEDAYREQFPEQELRENLIKPIDAAKIGGIGQFYESHYRMYCQYTHGTLRAVTGGIDEFSWADERCMGYAVMVAIEAIEGPDGVCSQFPPLREEFLREIQTEEGLQKMCSH